MTIAVLGDTVPTERSALHIDAVLFPSEPLETRSTDVALPFAWISGQEDDVEQSAYEEIYALAGAMSHGYWARLPLSVRVTFEGTEFVAEQPALDLFALGESPIDAVINLRERIAEHFSRLEELGDQLAPRMRQQRDLMARALVRVNA